MQTFVQGRRSSQAKHDNKAGKSSVLAAASDVVRSHGRPLDPAIRADAEKRFGFNLSHVQIHDDAAAAGSVAAAKARAYTLGSHIAFGSGEYQPGTAEGIGLVFHELVHVAQQVPGAPASPVPRSIARQHDPVEQEAHALADRRLLGGRLPAIANMLGPVIARYPKQGEELQNRELEALQHGQDPLAPVNAPPDPFQELIKKLLREPQPARKPPTIPGSRRQIEDAIPKVEAKDLFNDPAIQARLQAIVESVVAFENAQPGGKVVHNMDYFKDHFVNSVDYILYRRGAGKWKPLLDQLHAEERKRDNAGSPDIISQVEALRAKAQSDWLAETQRAADQFVTLAANEAQFLTIHQAAKPVRVFGLPASIEGTVKASDNRDVLEWNEKKKKGSDPVAPSVVKFMRAVQKEAKINVVAENYPGHAISNPWLGGDPKNVGQYSFDVHLDDFIKVNRGSSSDPNAEGFYDRKPLIDFFLAADRAAAATGMEWVAYYNDFEVAKAVNEKLGKLHIGFSGGGGNATFGKGSFHHGPEPYILHVHFNIMPIDRKEQFDRAQALKAAVTRVVLPFLEIFNPK